MSALDPGHPSWAVVDEIDEIAKYAGALQVVTPMTFALELKSSDALRRHCVDPWD